MLFLRLTWVPGGGLDHDRRHDHDFWEPVLLSSLLIRSSRPGLRVFEFFFPPSPGGVFLHCVRTLLRARTGGNARWCFLVQGKASIQWRFFFKFSLCLLGFYRARFSWLGIHWDWVSRFSTEGLLGGNDVTGCYKELALMQGWAKTTSPLHGLPSP